MPNPLKDPIFRLQCKGSIRRGSVSDILDAARSGELDTLPGLKAHYRPPAVTFFGIMEHLRRRYATRPDDTLATVLDGSEMFELYPLDGVPGFLQAAAPDLIERSGQTKSAPAIWQEADPLFYGIGHSSKLGICDHPSDEDVAFALIAAADRRSVSKNGGGPRWAIIPVFLSLDATIGSEINLLADAYDRSVAAGTTLGVFASPNSINDHFPFLFDPNATIDAADIAWPHIDSYRPFRMSKSASGAVGCVKQAGPWERFKRLRKHPNFEPHLATSTAENRSLYRPCKRAITYQDGIAVLFGNIKTTTQGKANSPKFSQDVLRASIMNLVDGERPIRYARVCGIGSVNGKTLGYREIIIPLDGPLDENRALEAGRLLDSIVRQTEDTLAEHLNLVFAGAGDAARGELSNELGDDVLRMVQRISSGDDEDAVTTLLNDRCRSAALSIFSLIAEDYRSSGSDWLRIARIENLLRKGLCHGLEGIMTDQNATKTNRQKGPEGLYVAIARKIMGHIGPSASETAKHIRASQTTDPSLDIWRIVASLELSETQVNDWLPAIRTAAECGSLVSHSHGGRDGIGKSLHQFDFSEERLARLLEETGEALLTTVLSIAHNGRSKGVASIDWSYPTALLLADANADTTACSALKAKIALSYCRTTPTRKKQ